MSDPAAASEHLKLIRSMMERATVYRAISAPAAIFGGILACVMSGVFIAKAGSDGPPLAGRSFFWSWVAVLAVVGAFNAILLWRKSRAAGERLWSPGMKHAVFALAPALLVGGLVSYSLLADHDDFELGTLVWILCYGASLLAMGGIAPRSIRRLGWMFLIAGVVLFTLYRVLAAAVKPQLGIGDVEFASGMMIATFGVLHLVHGAGVLLRRAGGAEEV